MPRPGPKRKPAKEKRREGDAGHKNPPADREPTKLYSLSAPTFLGKFAAAEWNRIAPILNRTGFFGEEDRAALIAYCVTWECFRKAYAIVKKPQGLISKTKTGYIQMSQAYSVMQKAAKDLLAFSNEFGMTPAARVGMDGGAGTGVSPGTPAGKGEVPREEAEDFGDPPAPGAGEGSKTLTH